MALAWLRERVARAHGSSATGQGASTSADMDEVALESFKGTAAAADQKSEQQLLAIALGFRGRQVQRDHATAGID